MKVYKHIFLLTIFLSGPLSLWALRVVPTYQVFRVKPGQKTIGQLTITNSEETDIMVTPSTRHFYYLPSNKKIQITDWLKIDTQEFPLKKGESKTISFVVHAPKSAKGELAGNLHFNTRAEDKTGVSLSLSLAIYAAVDGTEKPEIKIPAFAVDLSSHTSFTLLINNTGNIHVRPRGFVHVYDHDDQLLLNAEVMIGAPALPAQPRMYQAVVKDFRLPEGRYRADIQLEDVDYGIQLPAQKYKFRINKAGKTEAD